ncbi:hypothetical protein JWG45_01750 [Leptospira sp. 201903070]|uniref:Uncharacterized protein n=1 Tax=Leptospira ainlahdjerensis TaxID=2810033 RepID=A0ABS2U668_9LEPT|nr:hypothetical protein [Leptospira ainlahdjerensis]MBM9575866.1 hypothetical protein [Leptospira ainlahdjerensis]
MIIEKHLTNPNRKTDLSAEGSDSYITRSSEGFSFSIKETFFDKILYKKSFIRSLRANVRKNLRGE